MLGNNILKLRKQLGFSQEELSEKVNVTRQTISNWELNETQPNPEQLKLLSKALNVSVDDLIGNDIKNVVEEKIDSTEKNTKIIIRVLTIRNQRGKYGQYTSLFAYGRPSDPAKASDQCDQGYRADFGAAKGA